MNGRVCLYPGSFDPVTVGHMDMIRRAAALYETVHVAVLHNPAKRGCFPVEERVAMLRAACADIPNVRVTSFDGLTVRCAQALGADVLLRGLRGAADCDGELRLAMANRRIAPEIETVTLFARPEFCDVSSSVVREMAAFGADIAGMVPDCVLESVRMHFRSGIEG